ncbi:acetyltransferase, ribosomal protein N-acetylase [Actinoalloteichus hymeniacidonis]|uniref:Acetyltransferase, ribosomal protein N-acetylase n=2 Tax=Actinoalloteichus hymeniacidonis TaxID=340345 RepID=A0AAC9N0L6_9PSEU|nr:acetyltransferase, ribosomal protein N-acetylase [Actinoalloteichus hymeniacidonis]
MPDRGGHTLTVAEYRDATPLAVVGDPVGLRDWEPADIAPLRDYLRPDRPWYDTNGPYFGRPTAAEIAARIGRIESIAGLSAEEREVPRRSVAVVETGSDRLVGEVSWYWESEPTDWRRMGVVIYDESVWGRGYGTEALRLWTDLLFSITDALRLDFATYSGNPGMLAVGTRLGFTEEARFRRARRWSGGVHDSVVFGILREEWESVNSNNKIG